MLRYVLFDTTLFSPDDNQPGARRDLGWLLEALTQRDQQYLKDHPDAPRLYASGITYERPAQFQGECPEVQDLRQLMGSNANTPKGRELLKQIQQVLGGERFRDYGRMLEKKTVDCDNLASARSAELRQAGIPADPYIKWRKRLDGGNTYHVIVRWPDQGLFPGEPDMLLEDPSLLLGMGGAKRAADRQVEIAKSARRAEKYGALAGAPDGSVSTKDTSLDTALSDILGRTAVAGDEFLDFDPEVSESFDERLLHHSGLMRGRY